MELQTNYFTIADHHLCISFHPSQKNSMHLIPSFEPFRSEKFGEDDELFFELTVDDNLKPIAKDKRELIRKFETGNGDTTVDLLDNGGYQYIIKNVKGADCCMLQTDKDFKHCKCALNGNYNMRCFGLSNALMLIFAFAGSRKETLLIHASLVRQAGYGYAFIAKSGAGKSTQVSMWLRYLEGCDLMNDDNPVIRMIDGKPYIFGSPWSGKTPCYRNVKAKLGAITQIDRASANSIEPLKPVEAFASMLVSCSMMKWDKDIFNRICDTVTHIIETTGIYILHCLPNKEAAEVCHKAIAKQ